MPTIRKSELRIIRKFLLVKDDGQDRLAQAKSNLVIATGREALDHAAYHRRRIITSYFTDRTLQSRNRLVFFFLL